MNSKKSMGNFISKEDILVEIAVLFKKMDNGKLTIEELEELVKLSRDLHERTLILRYKAFEEKVFGERPTPVVDVQEEISENNFSEPEIETIDEEIPVVEAVIETPTIEEEQIEEAPLFKVEVKDDAPFGFSLFGNDLEEEIPEITANDEPINSIIEDQIVANTAEQIANNETVVESIIEEPTPTPVREMSDIERAHAENLARYLAKTQAEQAQSQASIFETPKVEPVAPSPSAPQFEKVESFFTPKVEPLKEIPAEEEIHVSVPTPDPIVVTPVEETIYQAPIAQIVTPDSVEDIQSPIVEENEKVEQTSSFSYGDLAAYIHKYNLVDSNLASQFGVTKINSLIGSFGLNERLQFINELFDGSSEGFSEAIKVLDVQASSENARTKVAEIAATNNWEVESETVVEFMQKVIRRYA